MLPNQNNNSDEEHEENLSNNSSDPFDLKMEIPYFNSNTEKNNGKIDEDSLFKSEKIDQDEKENDLLDGENNILGTKMLGDNFLSENLSSNMKEFDDISMVSKKLNLNDSNNISTSKKNIPLNIKGSKKDLFETIFPKKNDIIASTSTQINNGITSQNRPIEKEIYEGTKLMDAYNIKVKIITHFYNQYIFNNINKEIKKINPKFFINIFPRSFILRVIAKKQQKESFKLTLEEIYAKSNHENYGILKQLRSDEYKKILEKSGLGKKLEMKISDLYKEYLDSDEFNKDIKKFKETIGNEYAEKYSKVANNL